jgi:hypothetical protein
MNESSTCESFNKVYEQGYRDAKEDILPELSNEEQAYRRGFSQGFFTGKTNPDLDYKKINEWRYSKKTVGAPGTCMENKEF